VIEDRRLRLAGAVGLALIAAAVVSDFLVGAFWERHALLTSLVANILVVAVTVIVVNEVLERRDRHRWNLLAQSVLFALIQSARATWTTMVEILRLAEVESGAVEPLLAAAEVARDSARVSKAANELLGDPQRRARPPCRAGGTPGVAEQRAHPQRAPRGPESPRSQPHPQQRRQRARR
jgi:hypothetical protein